MATETTITRPAPFVETLGEDLAKQVVAQTGVPIVTGGIGTLSKQPGETDAGFKARQDAARAFTTRQQNLAGLAPQVAGQDALQRQAQTLATQGVGSFQPFLQRAQTEATLASGLGTTALGQLGTAGTELTQAGTPLGGIPTGAMTTAQTQQFMSPYQQQVIDASLAEFDRNKQIQEQGIRDQQAALGAQQQQLQGTDIATLGSLGAINQAQTQAGLDATREATRMAAFQPQEQLDRYAGQVAGIMGGYPGATQTTNVPNPTPLQTALGIGTTLAGLYLGRK